MSLIKKLGNDISTFPTLFNDLFNQELFNWSSNNFSSTRTTMPSINIKETADNFEVDAPGMEKNGFHITLEGNYLTTSSSKEPKGENTDGNYTHREFSYESFQRSFELPKDVVDEESIKVRYDNGMLHLTIPKKEEAKKKGPRLIEIG